MNDQPTFSLARIFDQYIADHRFSMEQVQAIDQTNTLAQVIGLDDVNTMALEWTLEAQRLAKLDPDDSVAAFWRQAAVELATYRIVMGHRQ